MLKGPSGSKRKAAASEVAVPGKRSTDVLVPKEVLRTVASSLNAATFKLMDLQCTDIAARGRVVAVMAECKREINKALGIKRRGASVLAISDVIVDVFQFVRRQELDTLQIVSRRFNSIIEDKLTLVCLRQLKSAKVSRCRGERQFVLIINVVGAGQTRLLTGVDDEDAAMNFLLNACRSSSVGSLQLYGKTPMSGQFFDSLALRAPTIFAKNLCLGQRTLAEGGADDNVLRAMQTFAELEALRTAAAKDANLQSCLIRTCFKAGVNLYSYQIAECDTAIVENALLEFCFGVCDEGYAERDRFLFLDFATPLKSDFLKRWIERAEVTDCRHKLTLDITICEGRLRQEVAVLDAYKQDGQDEDQERFESVSGRRWAATCIVDEIYGDSITFKINH